MANGFNGTEPMFRAKIDTSPATQTELSEFVGRLRPPTDVDGARFTLGEVGGEDPVAETKAYTAGDSHFYLLLPRCTQADALARRGAGPDPGRYRVPAIARPGGHRQLAFDQKPRWRADPDALDAQGGFTSGMPLLPYGPDHGALNVARQAEKSDSFLNETRRLLALRQTSTALRNGAITDLKVEGEVLTFRRIGRGQAMLCRFNFGSTTQNDLPAYAACISEGRP